MTEELNNFNTDMKELFIKNEIDSILVAMNEKPLEDIKEIAYVNYDVVKKYYDSQKFDLLFTHIRFVAYACFCSEYAGKAQAITEDELTEMMKIYTAIYEMMQARQQ